MLKYMDRTKFLIKIDQIEKKSQKIPITKQLKFHLIG